MNKNRFILLPVTLRERDTPQTTTKRTPGSTSATLIPFKHAQQKPPEINDVQRVFLREKLLAKLCEHNRDSFYI